jgi:hypothetical protein
MRLYKYLPELTVDNQAEDQTGEAPGCPGCRPSIQPQNPKRGCDGEEAARRVLTVRPRTEFALTESSAANSLRTGQNRSVIQS